MRRAIFRRAVRSALSALLLAAVVLHAAPAVAQSRAERDGITMYWGLVPAAIASQRHALSEMHGATPKDEGTAHHLVVALFRRDGTRIADAVVRAQLSEIGIVDAPPKYLTPMAVDGHASYGQVFTTAKGGPYRFRVLVKLPERGEDLVFEASAWSPHREAR